MGVLIDYLYISARDTDKRSVIRFATIAAIRDTLRAVAADFVTLFYGDMSLDISQRSLTIPVSVVLQRRIVKGAFWEAPVWTLDSVLVGQGLVNDEADGEELSAGPAQLTDPSITRHLWGGFAVCLYRDACERYWHALIGDEPKVYVVMKEDEVDASTEPAIVTIDYDEATAHSETDAEVLTAEIPGELYRIMEQYVLEHYKPVAFEKRKRKNWKKAEREGATADANGAQTAVDEPGSDPWDEKRRFFRPGYHG